MCGDERIPLSNQSYGFGPSGRHNGEIVLVEVNLPTLRKYLAEKKDWDVKIGRSEPFCLTADYRMGILLFHPFLGRQSGLTFTRGSRHRFYLRESKRDITV